jgi:hypothetical protein
VAVTFAPEALIASTKALRLFPVGVMVTGVPATVSVNELAEVMDCVDGSCTAGRLLLLSALVGAPALIT